MVFEQPARALASCTSPCVFGLLVLSPRQQRMSEPGLAFSRRRRKGDSVAQKETALRMAPSFEVLIAHLILAWGNALSFSPSSSTSFSTLTPDKRGCDAIEWRSFQVDARLSRDRTLTIGGALVEMAFRDSNRQLPETTPF